MTKILTVIVVLGVTGSSLAQQRRPNQRPAPVDELQVPGNRRPPPPSANRRPPPPVNPPKPSFGRFVPVADEPSNRKPLKFPSSDEETRRSNFIDSSPPRQQQNSRFKARPQPVKQTGSRPIQAAPRPRPVQQKRPVFDYDDYEDPLPSGPTRIPPLPSGPTRRPGQPTRQTGPGLGVPRDVFNSLPLLTTQRPGSTATPRANVNFLLDPPSAQPEEPTFQLPTLDGSRRNGLLVSGSLDILDQTSLFTKMDPHQEQFIKAPRLNAGALPLAVESSLPLGRFPPFNNPA